MDNRERILRNIISVLQAHKYNIEFGEEVVTSIHTHDTINASVEAGSYDKYGDMYCWGLQCEIKLVFTDDSPRMISYKITDLDSSSILDEGMVVSELGFVEILDSTLTLKGLPF